MGSPKVSVAGVEFKKRVSGNRKAELRETVMQMVEGLGGVGCACKWKQRYKWGGFSAVDRRWYWSPG